jgi:hypothetical protein
MRLDSHGRTLSILNQKPELEFAIGINDTEVAPRLNTPNVIPEDNDDLDVEARRKNVSDESANEDSANYENGDTEDDASKSDSTEDRRGAGTRLAKSHKLKHEMRKLDSSFNPQARETMAQQPIVAEDEDGKKGVEMWKCGNCEFFI